MAVVEEGLEPTGVAEGPSPVSSPTQAQAAAAQELCEAAAHVNAAMARQVELLGRMETDEHWGEWGIRSLAHWASINLGLDPRSCTDQAATARALRELPRIAAQFSTGELSFAKVRAVARVATPETEARWAALARQASLSQLVRIASAYRRAAQVDQPDASAARLDHWRRELHLNTQDDGWVRVVALLEPDDASLVKAALEAAMENRWRQDQPQAEPDTARGPWATRAADALVEISESALETGPRPMVGSERHQVVVHVDAGVLEGASPDGRCQVSGAGVLSAHTARRLGCDASVRALTEAPDGRPLDVGRSRRVVPGALRRALQARDGGCGYPGCANTRFVDAHHIVHWAQGGPTSLENLVLLCRGHHRLHHEGRYAMARDPGDGGLRFYDPAGREIAPPTARSAPRRMPPRCSHPPPAGNPRALDGGDPRWSLDLTLTALMYAAPWSDP